MPFGIEFSRKLVSFSCEGYLPPTHESLKMWGANFELETEVEFDSKGVKNPNETFMRADPVLMEVGPGQPQGQKRKLLD